MMVPLTECTPDKGDVCLDRQLLEHDLFTRSLLFHRHVASLAYSGCIDINTKAQISCARSK